MKLVPLTYRVVLNSAKQKKQQSQELFLQVQHRKNLWRRKLLL